MQNAQEINWLAIILPSLITGLIVIITQIGVGFWVTRKNEEYKNDFTLDLKSFENALSKRLADYQKDINKDLYQFQTKYSLFHQREADAIAKLYEILIDLEQIVKHTFYRFGDQKQESTHQAVNKYHEYINFYLKNQIYFDDELCRKIEEIRNLVGEMIDQYLSTTDNTEHKFSSETTSYLVETARDELNTHQRFRTEFPKLKNGLRNKFRQLLSVETPDTQLEKQN